MPHVATAADIEMRLLLEAVYAKYSHDFRDYSGASLKRRVQHALLQFGCDTISQLQSQGAARPGRVPAAAGDPDDPVHRDVPRPDLLARAAPAGGAAAAHLSVAEGVGGRLRHRRGGVLAGDPAAGGRPARTHAASTPPTSTRRSLEKARQGIFPIAAVRQHTANYQAAGGKRAFSDYYSAAYNAARFDPDLIRNVTFADHSLATDTRVLRDALHLVPQRADLLQQGACRTARSACSTSRCAIAASWAWAARRASTSRTSPTSSSRSPSASASSARHDVAVSSPEAVDAAAARRIEAVVIGASAGGFEALLAILKGLPATLSDAARRGAAPAGQPREPARRAVRLPPGAAGARGARQGVAGARHALLRAARATTCRSRTTAASRSVARIA